MLKLVLNHEVRYKSIALMIGSSLCVSVNKLPAGFPQITQAPSTKVVEIGHNAVLQCSAVGTPLPRISWVRDMLPVDPSKNSRYSILDTGTGMPGTLGVVAVCK